MLGKELFAHVQDTAVAVRRLLAPAPEPSYSPGASECRFLRTLSAYISSTAATEGTEARDVVERLSATAGSGRWSAVEREGLASILRENSIYEHRRTLFPGIDSLVRARITAILEESGR